MESQGIPGGLDLGALQQLPLTVELCEKIIGMIQAGIYQGATFNSEESFHPPMRFVKDNGQLMVTEIRYGNQFKNSYLDILYPSSDLSLKRPTVVYTHGGGFFGGSKSMGDPMAAGDSKNFLYEDIAAAGFNFVNVDYVLTPEGHFPDQLIQLIQAIDFLCEHAEEYSLDMSRVAVMGSSAGAILTGQYGTLLTSETYRKTLGIYPRISPDAVRCLVIDDAPFRPEKFNWALKAMMGNFLQTVDFDSEIVKKYNAYAYFNASMPPCFFDAGPKDGFPEDMQACAEKLKGLGIESEVYIPKSLLPHGFLNLAKENEEAAEGEMRVISFLKKHML